MMRTFALLLSITAITGLLNESQAQQAPDLKTAADFAVFTSAGDFTNDGTTLVTGDIGTNTTILTGFPPGVVVGETHVNDPATTQAALDLASAYAELSANTCETVLGTTLGNGQTLTSGVYCLGAASSLNGDLTLDAEGQLGAIFIIKIDGALSTTADSRVLLTNLASAGNVYWLVNGALELATNSLFQGTVLGSGAISLLEGASLFGRALTTAGAVALHNNVVTLVDIPLPVTLTSFTVKKGEGQTALLRWTTTQETNSDRFEIQQSVSGKTWRSLGSVSANGESKSVKSYEFTDLAPLNGSNLYRLKMIDKDETFAYSGIRDMQLRTENKAVLYPNPALDKLNLDVADISQISRIQLNDISGKAIYDQSKASYGNLPSSLNVTSLPAGLYVVRLTSAEGVVSSTKILKQ